MPDIPAAQLLPVVRIAVGAGSYAFPEQTGPLFGFSVNPESAYLARLFGIRDVAMGLGYLTAKSESKKLWLGLGLACDAADAVGGILGLKGGAPKRAMIMSTATALLAVGLGVSALTGAGGTDSE